MPSGNEDGRRDPPAEDEEGKRAEDEQPLLRVEGVLLLACLYDLILREAGMDNCLFVPV